MSQNDHKSKRVRSPAYPSFDLRVAIGHAQTIYRHEKRSAAPVSIVAGHCGYDSSSSSGLRLVAALKQFGLLHESGGGDDRKVRLTDRALDILHAESEESPERLKAIRAAALSPKIHKSIWDHYSGNLPPDATLQSFLLRQMEFNDSTVGKFIKELRSTVAFANLEESDTIEESESPAETIKQAAKPDADSYSVPTGATATNMRDFPVTLPSLNIAVVRVPAKMTELDFSTLINMLKAWKPALVSGPSGSASDHTDHYLGEDDESDLDEQVA
ncbi:MAG: hypothetical protein SGJ20_15025 [Planctomycetota bacterium]|nr:hypothetical protein [Planctomycetota bacterium]